MSGIQVSEKLISFLIFLPLFFISLAVHEFSHAFFANKFGDDTAKKLGRLTLNPVKHIDLVGSILMPLIAFSSGYLIIGWAKPVPVNRNNFRNPLKNDLVVTAAGPVSNFLLAFVFYFILMLLNNFNPAGMHLIKKVAWLGIYFNVFLFAFNLLPIPPLDGSHILYDLFPGELTAKYLNLGIYGTVLLFVFIYSPLWSMFMGLVSFLIDLFFT